ncbi:T9SS type A sorting domain-containing protein [Flavobacterium sp.]|uniref:T9SS type A sorting domain-containing protein n=1 Tax=Flavobacterium sp. TaxID=239 RepID=UPI0026330C9D|nr:T9SS type A sorting domain-containing protein [Flavobacterium sp.]MDD3004150.1 T9SS type A sorting domain-containing protein [Flavobacterium sp.]
MKTSKIIFLILAVFITVVMRAQCPTTALTFSTQAQIDNFSTTYPNCTILLAGIDVTITGNNITNLDGLSGITQINGAVEIRNNPNLTSLLGLANLTTAGSDFIIRNNAVLTSLAGLENLTSIQGEFTIRTNPSLTSIAALNALSTTNLDVIIRDNDALSSLNGLNNITVVGGILEIVQNAVLNDVSALSNISLITGGDEGALVIEDNLLLTNLNNLGNANTQILGDLIIQNNPLLSQCAAQSICNYLNIPPANATITIALNNTGCNSSTEVQNLCVLGMPDHSVAAVQLFPNPVKEILTLSHSKTISSVHIVNLLGQNVFTKNYQDNLINIDLSSLSSGTYIVKTVINNQVLTSKFIKS